MQALHASFAVGFITRTRRGRRLGAWRQGCWPDPDAQVTRCSGYLVPGVRCLELPGTGVSGYPVSQVTRCLRLPGCRVGETDFIPCRLAEFNDIGAAGRLNVCSDGAGVIFARAAGLAELAGPRPALPGGPHRPKRPKKAKKPGRPPRPRRLRTLYQFSTYYIHPPSPRLSEGNTMYDLKGPVFRNFFALFSTSVFESQNFHT